MTPETLTPAEATNVVSNGGLVIGEVINVCYWQEGNYVVGSNGARHRLDAETCWFVVPHPLYPPDIFARTYPCTLPGPEAKALLMAAPVGMLWGCVESDAELWNDYAEYWDGQHFVSNSDQRYKWNKYSRFEIRLRPNWLESQRAKFARGEFGEVLTWRDVGGEIAQAEIGPEPTPKAGEVVDAQRAWELCKEGWVMADHVANEFAVRDGKVTSRGGMVMSSFNGFEMTLLRHEPWRTATIETGYCWSGQDAALALRAGMEGKLLEFGDFVHANGEEVIDESGECCNRITLTVAGFINSFPNTKFWALRWPAKENAEMDKQDETLTGWDVLSQMKEGEVWERDNSDNLYRREGDKLQTKKDSHWRHSCLYISDFVTSTFRRVPPRPTSKTLTLDNGLEVVVYADRVEADVPGCAIWKIPRSKVEAISKCEGGIGAKFEDVATYSGGPSQSASVHASGVKIHRYTITFTDLRRVFDTMREIGGGE